jgi:hypothetical protein
MAWLRPGFLVIVACAVLLALGGAPQEPPRPQPPEWLGVSTLQIADRRDEPRYDRKEWKHWVDEDGDCQATGAEVLIRQSLIPVTWRDSGQCHVESGLWLDPYTGKVARSASELDIDHLVPLKNTHQAGGVQWEEARKQDFANHLDYPWHLLAVNKSQNRKKGDRGPDRWKPENRDYWCPYAVAWIQVKSQWELTATLQEWRQLMKMLQTCRPSPSAKLDSRGRLS